MRRIPVEVGPRSPVVGSVWSRTTHSRPGPHVNEKQRGCSANVEPLTEQAQTNPFARWCADTRFEEEEKNGWNPRPNDMDAQKNAIK